MLFNSAEFLFAFLPITIAGYLLLQKHSKSASNWWLLVSSLTFYGIWNISFLPIIIGSISINYLISARITGGATLPRKAWLIFGISANLLMLGYFKYTNFFIDNLNIITGTNYRWADIVLPIGISFFTFQQIAFLVDTYRHVTIERHFGRYALFISFFPQLIAGPIVHHSELTHQFGRSRENRSRDFAEGLTLLVIGLIKKMVIADTAALPSSRLFDSVAHGTVLTTCDAWVAAISYSVQIYFDFSAYSDMAIGIARILGIDLPINFASPYKARNIGDFWKRWHITLSRFLRDYVYIPLGGNRQGKHRQAINVMLTMVLGGIWHGAGWTFLIWGALHGTYLAVSAIWQKSSLGQTLSKYRTWKFASWLITISLVLFAWVPFRAESLDATISIWSSMLHLNGPSSGNSAEFNDHNIIIVFLALLIATVSPNAYEILHHSKIGLPSRGYPATYISGTAKQPRWMWTWKHALVTSAGIIVIILKINDVSEFIYFQF